MVYTYLRLGPILKLALKFFSASLSNPQKVEFSESVISQKGKQIVIECLEIVVVPANGEIEN